MSEISSSSCSSQVVALLESRKGDSTTLRAYFKIVAALIRKFLLDSPSLHESTTDLFQGWMEDIRNLPRDAALKHSFEFTVEDHIYPPRLVIAEEVEIRPAQLQRSHFRYEWGYESGEKAESFPRHAFHSADSEHPEHHFHKNRRRHPLSSIGITAPESHPCLCEEFIEWLKRERGGKV